jgi:hypothetical protein
MVMEDYILKKPAELPDNVLLVDDETGEILA